MTTIRPVLRCQRSNATLRRAQDALDASLRRLKRLETDERAFSGLLDALETLQRSPKTTQEAIFGQNPDEKGADEAILDQNPPETACRASGSTNSTR